MQRPVNIHHPRHRPFTYVHSHGDEIRFPHLHLLRYLGFPGIVWQFHSRERYQSLHDLDPRYGYCSTNEQSGNMNSWYF